MTDYNVEKKLSEIYIAVKIHIFKGRNLLTRIRQLPQYKDGRRFEQGFYRRRHTHDQWTDEFMFGLIDSPRSLN